MVKNPPATAGDAGSIPGSPGGGNGNRLQYFCLENPMDRGAWRTAVKKVTKSQTELSTHARAMGVLMFREALLLRPDRDSRA